MHFSIDRQAFYSTKLGGVMPSDAIEITDEDYRALYDGLMQGKRAQRIDGLFVFADLAVYPAPSERAWRDAELANLVWLRDRHRDQLEIGAATTLTAEQFTELLTYMQALRDWPQSEQFPEIEHRPVAPPWIAEQTQ
ncbi:phage tail assembly chaperone [Pseudomonas sp.]|uniref:phage tail assembly chaperone n=1 Tax=Pseudomonas sp. TaxID=306 RepID=UPI003D6F6C1C